MELQIHLIELYIKQFLTEVNAGSYKISEDVLKRFSEETKIALKRQFERVNQPFTIRMSNIGRPSCQLTYEQAGFKGDSDPVRNWLGDLVEDLVMFILHAAKVPVVSEQEAVSLEIGGIKLNGTLDVIIDFGDDPRVWDIKSASSWAFLNKFKAGFEEIFRDDAFGYCDQLFLYAAAKGVRVGGFIVVDKSSGEILIVPVPERQDEYKDTILKRVSDKIEKLNRFKRVTNIPKGNISSTITKIPLIPEIFRKKPTGALLLAKPCTFCAFKYKCWKEVQLKTSEVSKAKNPVLKWYAEGENNELKS